MYSRGTCTSILTPSSPPPPTTSTLSHRHMDFTTTRCAYINQSQEVTVDTLSLKDLLPFENWVGSQLVLKPSEILIKVRAVALSSVDTAVLARSWQFHDNDDDDDEDHQLPVVTGYEFSGVVVAVGSAIARVNELQAAAAAAAVAAAASSTSGAVVGVLEEDFPTVRKGQAVVGLAPMNRRMGCMSEYTIQSVACVVPKPALVLHEDAASVVGPGLRVMTALHYHTTTHVDDVILIVQGASPTGRLAIQLAMHRGLRVLVTGDTADELNFLEDLGARASTQACGSMVRVLDTRLGSKDLVRKVLEETGHVGVDIVLEADSSVGPATTTEFKRAMLECLGSHGTYVTSRRDMQLDPGESERLSLKGASLSFIFEQTWALSPSKQGRYLHVMNELMRFVANGTVGTLVGGDCTSLGRARDAYRGLSERFGRCVVKIE